MNRDDFVKLIGSESAGSDYVPVAFLLRSGYACAGYYHGAINNDLSSTCVVLNAHLIELQDGNGSAGRPSIHDFNDFLEEIVTTFYGPERQPGDALTRRPQYSKSIPLAAIPLDEIAVMYPVSHIGALMRRAEEVERTASQGKKRPTFLDLDRSEIINLLRSKLW
jgi:hypothetical protein